VLFFEKVYELLVETPKKIPLWLHGRTCDGNIKMFHNYALKDKLDETGSG
jgi:hypothetical protein